MRANPKRLLILALAFGLALPSLALAVDPAQIRVQIPIEYPTLTPTVYNQVLAANVAETFTVPAKCDLIIFGQSAIFYLRSGGTAAVPAADVTDGTGSEISPAVRRVTPGDTFSLVAPAATIISLACYDIP